MSRRFFLNFHGRACLAFAMSCWVLSVGRGQEPKLRKEVLGLNEVTGKQTILAVADNLSADAARVKTLLAEALHMAQEKNHPLNYNAGIILGKLAVQERNLPAAETFYRIAMVAAAKLQSREKLEESYGDLIDAFFESKKFADAARVCRELLDLKTDDGKERIVLRAVIDWRGDVDFERDDAFDAARALRPSVKHIYIQTLAKQGKTDQALKLVDDLIKEENHWINLQLKARVLHDAGRYEDAAKVFEKVIVQVGKDQNISPTERGRRLEMYRYALSSVYIDLDKTEEASQLLQQLIAASPTNASYYNDLGYIWADKNIRLNDAEKLIRRALELDREQRKDSLGAERDNGAYLDSLGWVLFRQKRYKEAKEILLKAVEDVTGQHIEIYDHLGDACLALGDREGALLAWRKALESATDSRRDQQRKMVVEKKLRENQ